MANYNVDIQLQVQGYKKIQDLNNTVNRLNQETKELQGRLTKGNPFNAAGVTKLNKGLSDGVSKTQQLSKVNQKAARIQQGNIENLIKLRKELRRVESDNAARRARQQDNERRQAAKNKQSRGRAIGGAASGAIISAAFPVLTGGSAAESVFGGVGGLLGSALGPLGSFAGGIGGSALGRILTDAEELNKSLVALTAKFGDTGAAALFTADDVSELAKQLNITKEDVVSLAGELSAFAQLSAIEDLAKAFGPIGGAGTFDALAQAAESEAAALKAIDGLRGQIGLKTAEELLKVLEIEGSEAAQAALLDALLDKTADITGEVAKQVTFWDRIAAAIFTAASGEFIDPKDLAGERAADIVAPDQSVIDKALADYEAFLRRRKALDEKFNPKKERKGRAGGGALPQSQELQLRQEILKAELAANSIQGKRAALQLTDLEAVRAKESLLAASLVKETQILELARQQALTNSKFPADNALINELYDDRLKKIQSQNFLLREQNGLSEKNILLQQSLIALRNEQQTGGIVQRLERGIEDANSPGSSEMLELRIEQLRRQEDLIGAINDKLAEQRLIEASGDAKKAEAATLEIGFLNNRKAAIEALLPALNQAEQQQLKFNQAFAAVTPAVKSLVGGISEVVAGTKTAEEAFADFLKNIGDMLIQAAQQMIATYIAIGIAKAFAGMGSSGGGGGNDLNLGGIESYSGVGANTRFAEGGYVTGPTNALIGEGGEPEYVIPESKMRESMGRYSRGSRGGSVIPAEGGGAAGAEGGVAVAAPIDVRYSVERINSVDYVTADQFQNGMKRAAAEGAQRGQQLTLSRLQQSPATRRRIGM